MTGAHGVASIAVLLEKHPQFLKSRGDVIATIQWYSPWRKYALFPRKETVWEATCLKEMMAFLEQLMAERKKTT